MTHFLDTLPLDFARPGTQELLRFLSDTYFKESEVQDLVLAAGISPASIAWGQPGRQLWRDVLTKARLQDKLRTLLETIAAGPNAAVANRLSELLAAEPVTEAPAASGEVSWADKAGAMDAGELERQLEAEPTLLDIAFLERGLELAPAVCRLLVTSGTERFYGTGFRIGADLILTNHHVLFPSGEVPASGVEAWFGYEQSFAGAARAHTVVATDPATITGAADHDWGVVRTSEPMPEATPVVELPEALAKPVEVNDRVYIIQHPMGGTKKIGMIHNVVRYVDEDVIGYRTDTEGGSSGSPVFDEQWRLVALHHKWVVRQVGGRAAILNQGRRIERVRAALVARQLIGAGG